MGAHTKGFEAQGIPGRITQGTDRRPGGMGSTETSHFSCPRLYVSASLRFKNRPSAARSAGRCFSPYLPLCPESMRRKSDASL